MGRKDKRGALEAHLDMLGANPSPVFLVCFGAKQDLNVPYTNYVGKVMSGSSFIKHWQCSATGAATLLPFCPVLTPVSIYVFSVLIFTPNLSPKPWLWELSRLNEHMRTAENPNTTKQSLISLQGIFSSIPSPKQEQGGGKIPEEQPNDKNISAVAKSPIYFQMMCSNGMLLYIFWWDRSLFKKTGAFVCAFKPRLSIRTTSRVQWLGKKMTVMKSWESSRRKER